MPEPDDQRKLAQMLLDVETFMAQAKSDPEFAVPVLAAEMARRLYALAWQAVKEYVQRTQSPPCVFEALAQAVFAASRSDKEPAVVINTMRSAVVPWLTNYLSTRMVADGMAERLPVGLLFSGQVWGVVRGGRPTVLFAPPDECAVAAAKACGHAAEEGYRVLWLSSAEKNPGGLPATVVFVARQGWRHKLGTPTATKGWLSSAATMFGGVPPDLVVIDGASDGKEAEYAGRPLPVLAADVIHHLAKAAFSQKIAVLAMVHRDTQWPPNYDVQLKAHNDCFTVVGGTDIVAE